MSSQRELVIFGSYLLMSTKSDSHGSRQIAGPLFRHDHRDSYLSGRQPFPSLTPTCNVNPPTSMGTRSFLTPSAASAAY